MGDAEPAAAELEGLVEMAPDEAADGGGGNWLSFAAASALAASDELATAVYFAPTARSTEASARLSGTRVAPVT